MSRIVIASSRLRSAAEIRCRFTGPPRPGLAGAGLACAGLAWDRLMMITLSSPSVSASSTRTASRLAVGMFLPT